MRPSLLRSQLLAALLLGCFATACSSGTGEDTEEDTSGADVDASGGDATPDADVVAPDVREDVGEEVQEDVDSGTDVRDDVENDTADIQDDVEDDTADVQDDVEDDTADIQDDVEDDTADIQDDVEDDTADIEDDTTIECDPGFELVEGSCVDVDECETVDCGLGSCENTEGSFVCNCDDGATLIDDICVDNDECADAPCGDNASCTNIVGGFECACNDGFLGDGLECSEDVCAVYEPVEFTRPNGEADTVDCITESVCIARGNSGPLYNSVSEGAADRECATSLSPAGTEWALGRCAGAEVFAPLFATVGCSGSAVLDQDLCLHVIAEDLYFDVRFNQFQGGGPGGGFAYTRRAASGVCPLGAVCEPGVLPAACECPAGFALDAELGECVDLNECELDVLSCDESAVCVNTPGSFECECPAGSEFVGDVCVDIDECEAMPCDANASCVNLEPGFVCECNPGFGGDGFTCEIVCDPTCGENEVCVLGASVPVCECAPGFELDGDACVAIDFCERTDTVQIDLTIDDIDCVTPSVCLQQAGTEGALFNAIEEAYVDIDFDACSRRGVGTSSSPSGTRWLTGTCEENSGFTNEDFLSFADIGGCAPSDLSGQSVCMLSVADGIRVDFRFDFGFIGGTDLGGRGLAYRYDRSALPTCDDSNTCSSTSDGAVCGCVDGTSLLDDGTCDIEPYCTLDCGAAGQCVFGEAGQVCACPEGMRWDGGECAAVALCAGEVRYVHQPGADGDCWTDGVCITRDNRQQIYNAAAEQGADGCGGTSPRGVSFALGACDSVEGDFDTLSNLFGCGILGDAIVDTPLCALINSTGELIDVTFDSWTAGESIGLGGYGFSYARDVVSACAISASCDAELDECVCNDGFDGDGLTCAFAGVCDLDCGANGECVGGDVGPECLCDVGYADLGDGCVDVDVCADSERVFFSSTAETEFAPDCISEDVCLTRGSSGPLYNALSDDEPRTWSSTNPTGTLWADGECGTPGAFFGSLRDLRDSGYRPFQRVVGVPLCLRMIDTGVDYNIRFTSFDSDDGGFSYVRRRAELACGPDSTCVDNVGAPTCGCEAGFEANEEGICENIDDCASNPCGTDTCLDGVDTFFCICEAVTFEKSNFGDEVDCITEDVCITRGDFGPIYNDAVEAEAEIENCSSLLPSGTAWARGSCASDRPRGPFLGRTFADCAPPDVVGVPACLELTESGALYNIEFSSWQSGSEDSGLFDEAGNPIRGGGGFSYTRTAISEGAACEVP